MPMNIMVIDDDRLTREIIEGFLRKEGFDNIVMANSAEIAMNLLGITGSNTHTIDIDLILLDVVLPQMDGLQACSMIKNIELYADVPVIMVTGLNEKASLKLAFEAGAIDYITKPYDTVELLVRVRSALKLKSENDRRKMRESELYHTTQMLEKVVARLEQISSTDGLTGVANRRSFDERLVMEHKRILRMNYQNHKKASLSLILLDVDQFKPYNDTYGHLEGDHCLQNVARMLTTVINRPADLVARYGGEEFVILLPETNLKESCIVAERIRAAVENLQIQHIQSDASPFVTVSLGVSSFIPSEVTKTDQLVETADQAMYQAKTAGRNQVYALPLPI